MTDPYAGYQTSGQPAAAPVPGVVKLAGWSVILFGLLLALGTFLGIASGDMEAMQAQNPEIFEQFETEAEVQAVQAGFLAVTGCCGVVVLGIGVLLGVFTMKGRLWAAITGIILVGLITLLNGFGLAFMAVVDLPDGAAEPSALNIAMNVFTVVLGIVSIILLAMSMPAISRWRNNGSTQAQEAWNQYYAQQQQYQQGQQSPQDQQSPQSSSTPQDPPEQTGWGTDEPSDSSR
jgi:hypothetical protein